MRKVIAMKAAIVKGPGVTPVYGDFAEPVAGADDRLVTVTAAAISPVVRGRASGQHYSATNQFPFIAGIDGAGRLDDGSRVYFGMPKPPFGSMAERAAAPGFLCLPLPDGLDDVTAAAIANPGTSSWGALTIRARLQKGETVLVNGATGASGRLAVQIARHMGAAKVIATGRNAAVLDALGADATIVLNEDWDAVEERFKAEIAGGVDVVLDYLWGKSAERLLVAAAKTGIDDRPLRYVEIGSVSGADITLPSAVLRSTGITLMGSGIGGIPLDQVVQAVGELFAAAVTSGFGIATRPVPLANVEAAWNADDGGKRTVLTI
jgi:NADPH:quinone reductase-like Zn-dependent oxidoreductase